MSFTAYVRRDGAWAQIISDDGRDNSAGILGTLTEVAYAQLGRDPTKAVLIANELGQVFETLTARRYRADLDSMHRWLSLGWALLILSIISFGLTVATGLGVYGLVLFAVLALVYIGQIVGGFNEGEAGCATLVVLLLGLFMIPVIDGARRAAKGDRQAPSPISTRADEAAAGRAGESQLVRPPRPGLDPADSPPPRRKNPR